jgi:THO complex subunit 2
VRVALPGDASDGSDGPSLAASTTADVLWLVSCEVEMQPERRAKVVDLAKALCDGDDALCAPGLLIERCEGEFLEECGLIPSAVGWKKKEVRINTRLVYTQNKFNLLREESEGYSKLVVALAAFGERGSGDDDTVAGAIRSTQARSISRRFPYDRVGAVNADP